MSEVIDHVGIRVSDLATSRRMYETALAELGFLVLGEDEFEGDAYVLFGRGTGDDFALHAVGTEPGRDRVTTGAHVAFRAPDTVSVERWHAAAIANGGKLVRPHLALQVEEGGGTPHSPPRVVHTFPSPAPQSVGLNPTYLNAVQVSGGGRLGVWTSPSSCVSWPPPMPMTRLMKSRSGCSGNLKTIRSPRRTGRR